MNSTEITPDADKPAYLQALEAVFGGPSQEGFGSAVFFTPGAQNVALEESVQACYQHFVGKLWEKWGAQAWLGPWRETYVRGGSTQKDIIAELRGIEDTENRQQAAMLLETNDNPAAAQAAVATAYNDPGVTELRVYNIGDGEAMSGLLIAGLRDNAELTILAFLMD